MLLSLAAVLSKAFFTVVRTFVAWVGLLKRFPVAAGAAFFLRDFAYLVVLFFDVVWFCICRLLLLGWFTVARQFDGLNSPLPVCSPN
jgi:hypothetical protein